MFLIFGQIRTIFLEFLTAKSFFVSGSKYKRTLVLNGFDTIIFYGNFQILKGRFEDPEMKRLVFGCLCAIESTP